MFFIRNTVPKCLNQVINEIYVNALRLYDTHTIMNVIGDPTIRKYGTIMNSQ